MGESLVNLHVKLNVEYITQYDMVQSYGEELQIAGLTWRGANQKKEFHQLRKSKFNLRFMAGNLITKSQLCCKNNLSS